MPLRATSRAEPSCAATATGSDSIQAMVTPTQHDDDAPGNKKVLADVPAVLRLRARIGTRRAVVWSAGTRLISRASLSTAPT